MSYSGPCIVRLPGESDHVPRIAEERRGYVTVLTDHHLLKICPIAPLLMKAAGCLLNLKAIMFPE